METDMVRPLRCRARPEPAFARRNLRSGDYAWPKCAVSGNRWCWVDTKPRA